jgi:hypothetical protein
MESMNWKQNQSMDNKNGQDEVAPHIDQNLRVQARGRKLATKNVLVNVHHLSNEITQFKTIKYLGSTTHARTHI